MIRHYKTKGFTLVELMLATTFVSILLISIVGVVMQIVSIYNKGLTIKAVNQASIAIADDMKRVFGQSKPLELPIPPASNNVYVDKKDPSGNPTGGLLCTGIYTYAWNYKDYRNSNPFINRYSSSDTLPSIRFVRFPDKDGDKCKIANRNLNIPTSGTVELIKDESLKIQSFTIELLDYDPKSRSALYQIKITLSSGDQSGINATNPLDAKCYEPGDSRSNNDFCAVNQIKFTATAGKMEVQI